MKAGVMDRKARDKAAELLRQFASGRITNFELENCWPTSIDPAIRGLESTIWCFYDDFKEHTLQGPFALAPEMRRVVARWIVFLHTNEPYKWPNIAYPGVRPLRRSWITRRLNLINLITRREQRFLKAGAFEVWPFISAQSFENARRRPRLLSGGIRKLRT
nr:putative integron gene cassette protein [uncultured bacterium]